MEFTVKPMLVNLKLARECPSGAVGVTGELAFYTDRGVELAKRTVGGYGGLKVEMTDGLRDAGLKFMELYLGMVREALAKEEREKIAL